MSNVIAVDMSNVIAVIIEYYCANCYISNVIAVIINCAIIISNVIVPLLLDRM